MNFDELLAAALDLGPRDRMRLAERVLASLDTSWLLENERAWVEEAQRRAEQMVAGTLSSRPAEDVLRDAQSRL